MIKQSFYDIKSIRTDRLKTETDILMTNGNKISDNNLKVGDLHDINEHVFSSITF